MSPAMTLRDPQLDLGFVKKLCKTFWSPGHWNVKWTLGSVKGSRLAVGGRDHGLGATWKVILIFLNVRREGSTQGGTSRCL